MSYIKVGAHHDRALFYGKQLRMLPISSLGGFAWSLALPTLICTAALILPTSTSWKQPLGLRSFRILLEAEHDS